MKNIILFGPPGAGKGTQAKIISSEYNISHLSTGDILRSKIQEADELGLKVKDIINSGNLVSDDILNSIVAEKILNKNSNGFMLDGYPRTLEQSFFLTKLLEKNSININYIFCINISFEIIKKRIIKRSKEEGRKDDNLDVIEKRYLLYLDTTQKVCDYFRDLKKDIYFEFNGDDEVSNITSKIKKIMET